MRESKMTGSNGINQSPMYANNIKVIFRGEGKGRSG
jgi:hypothetical protein